VKLSTFDSLNLYGNHFQDSTEFLLASIVSSEKQVFIGHAEQKAIHPMADTGKQVTLRVFTLK